MHDQLQTRLEELKKEFAMGQTRLQELERQQMHLRETMLRISGAIQVLEELLADGHPAEQNGARLGETQHISGQANAVNVMDGAFQVSNLEEHDHQPSQDSMARDALVEQAT